jgi:hypothetical protein
VLRFFSERTKYSDGLVFSFAIIACSILAYFLLQKDHYSLIYYGDSVSHLVISRGVFDSLQPSAGLLGSVWLPVTHILLMPFVAIDFLFHTGLAGTIVSTISTAAALLILFRVVNLQFNSSTIIALTACVVYLSNPSVLYMGIVPMTEAPFLMFLMLSAYYMQKLFYSKTDYNNQELHYLSKTGLGTKQLMLVIKCSLAISATTLTRYEGWVLPFILIIILIILKPKRRRTKDIVDRYANNDDNNTNRNNKIFTGILLMLSVALAFSGILFWFVWNLLYYKDPLYFATGPYSAQTLSKSFTDYHHLNPLQKLSILFEVSKDMYGIPILILSISGSLLYLYNSRKSPRTNFFSYILTILILASPMLSEYLAMLQGSGVIYPAGGGGWLAGRYVIVLAPLLAFSSASSVAATISFTRIREGKDNRISLKYRIVPSILILLIICFSLFTFLSQPVEIGKTTVLNDRYALLPFLKHFKFAFYTAKILNSKYSDKGARIVLFTPSQSGQQIMLESGIPLKNFITTSSGSYWQISKITPWIYGTYVIIRKPIDVHTDPTNDIIDYWNAHSKGLLKYYSLIYENQYYKMLKRRL